MYGCLRLLYVNSKIIHSKQPPISHLAENGLNQKNLFVNDSPTQKLRIEYRLFNRSKLKMTLIKKFLFILIMLARKGAYLHSLSINFISYTVYGKAFLEE